MISPQNNQRRLRLGLSVNNADLSLHGKRRKKKKTKPEQRNFSRQSHKIFLQIKTLIDKTPRELFL
jgi:hypothetical protein